MSGSEGIHHSKRLVAALSATRACRPQSAHLVRCSNDAVRRVQIARRLAFRESSASRPLALPGTTDHAAPYPSCCAKAEHQQANRLAHLSPYIFDASSIDGRRAGDHAGTTASLDYTGHARQLHAGGHCRRAQCTGGCCRALVPTKNTRMTRHDDI